jgi:hypothetical protein
MRDLKGPIICGLASGLLASALSVGEPTVANDHLTRFDAPVALTHGVCSDDASEDVLSPEVHVFLAFNDIFASTSVEIPETLTDFDVVFSLQSEQPLRVAQIDSDLDALPENLERLGEPAPESPF